MAVQQEAVAENGDRNDPARADRSSTSERERQSAARRTAFVIWLLTGAIAAWVCSLTFSAAHIGTEYVPVGNDSFYHARRILDTAQDPAAFYEFDSRIHVPEGSLLVWPWGYDYLMAAIVRTGTALGISSEPMAILIWIPVAAVFLSVGLGIAIARRLGLSAPLTALAALCMAFAPSTRLLHGTGEIDHHFAELIFLLGSLAAGLAWFVRPTVATAVTLGIVLGVAPAMHNGLFILQMPLLVTLFVRWLSGLDLPPRAALAFSLALPIATLAVLLPSAPFQMGRFEFYTLSWFHAYIAAATAVLSVFLARTRPTRRSAVMLAAISAALVAGILTQLEVATGFLGGTFERLQRIAEMRSPFSLAVHDPIGLSKFYSFLIWLFPLTLMLCLVQCWRQRRSPLLLFWVTSACGLVLLSTQWRMHYFGSFALYLPWLAWLQEFASKRPGRERPVVLATALAFLLAYAPQLRYELLDAPPKAGDPSYARIAPLLSILQNACAEDPGIVLADTDAGHYIRYATDCSVIANNFLLTSQHFAKADQVDQLYSLSAADLLAAPPHPKYVLARPMSISRDAGDSYRYGFFGEGPHRLAPELLTTSPARLPAQLRLLGMIPLPMASNVAYATLYKIERDPPTAHPIDTEPRP